MGLRKVYKQYDIVRKEAEKLQKWLLKNFEESKMYENFVDNITNYSPQSNDIAEEMEDIRVYG